MQTMDPAWMSGAIRPPASRLVSLDALRAVALYGVILINLLGVTMMVAARELMATVGPLDMAVAVVNAAFVHGKARCCFAFLFGLGFGMAIEKSPAAGEDPARTHLRRMAVLLVFGLVNQAFLFWGDILTHYALLGALLPLTCRWSDRSLLGAGALLIALPPLLSGAFLGLTGAPIPAFAEADPAARAAQAYAAYTSPRYFDAVAQNIGFQAHAYATQTAHRIEYDLALLGLFLFGLVAARRRLLLEPGRHRALLRRIAAWCLPIGFVVGGAHVAGFLGIVPDGRWKGIAVAGFAGLPVMAFGIMAALILWFSRSAIRLQKALAPAGRMSLTNYLLSGGIATWAFYGYGLGLLGRLNIAGMTLFALLLCAALTAVSHLWLGHFRLGPAEWLWRSLTHGRSEPLLRRGPAGLSARGA